jgi:hypothetical protein
MSDLPPHLQQALGRYHAEDSTWILVAQLELFGCILQVRRLTLGNPAADGFGTVTTVYETPAKGDPRE